MKPPPLEELPKHSEWAAHLLDPAGDPPGDPEAYTGTETYEAQRAGMLEAYREQSIDPAAFERAVRTEHRSDPGAISIGGELFLASPEELLQRERATVRDALAPVIAERSADGPSVDGPSAETASAEDAVTVVDLGCGWGRALRTIADAFPDVDLVGGEYGANGVALARALTADRDRIRFERFDFTAGEDTEGASDRTASDPLGWELVEEIDGEPIVFTRGAVTTPDDAAPVVDRLADLATDGDVAAGVHLEQVDAHPDTTLGLLRRHYSRTRGYDDSLLDVLEAHEDLVVTDVAYDVVGANPLHPLTRIRWEPAE